MWGNTDFYTTVKKKKNTPRRINPFAQKYLMTIYYVSHMKNEKPFSHRIYSPVTQAVYTNEWLSSVFRVAQEGEEAVDGATYHMGS